MATLLELRDLATGGEAAQFRERLIAAITVKARALVIAQNPTEAQLAWAKSALEDPRRYEQTVLHYGLAAGIESTPQQILALNDEFIIAAVSLVVDELLAR
jgi:hypothetical protein